MKPWESQKTINRAIICNLPCHFLFFILSNILASIVKTAVLIETVPTDHSLITHIDQFHDILLLVNLFQKVCTNVRFLFLQPQEVVE